MLAGLQVDLKVSPQGARFPEAIAQIAKADGDAKKVNFDVKFFANLMALQGGFKELFSKKFTVPYVSNAGDMITLLYQALAQMVIDESSSEIVENRIKVDFTKGVPVEIPDPVEPSLPDAEPLEEPEPDPAP